jgi:hypothetical protein
VSQGDIDTLAMSPSGDQVALRENRGRGPSSQLAVLAAHPWQTQRVIPVASSCSRGLYDYPRWIAPTLQSPATLYAIRQCHHVGAADTNDIVELDTVRRTATVLRSIPTPEVLQFRVIFTAHGLAFLYQNNATGNQLPLERADPPRGGVSPAVQRIRDLMLPLG